MLKAVGLFGRKKSNRPFKDFYTEWFNALKNTLLPLLHRLISDTSSLDQLSTHVDNLYCHFQSYYDALDLAASNDVAAVAQLLHPDWRTPLEKPFLWLGDLHPYLFTNLLRSFLDQNDTSDSENDEDDSVVVQFGGESPDLSSNNAAPLLISSVWKNPPKPLMAKVEEIERGMRLMVPALVARVRQAQAGFVDRVAQNWASCDGGKRVAAQMVGEAMKAQMEEMVSVFVDANRLRRSVLAEIIGALNVCQAALFLEGVAQFLVGFRNPELLALFEVSKLPLHDKQPRLAI